MSYNYNIHTGLYSNRAKEILTNMINPEKNLFAGWASLRDRSIFINENPFKHNNVQRVFIDIAPNGEILIGTNAWHSTIVNADKSEAKQHDWLAWRLKNIVKWQLGANAWKRGNTALVAGFNNVTVNDIYCIYEIVLQRKRLEKHYSIDLIRELKGIERDPFLTELELTRRQAILDIRKEFSIKINAVNVEYSNLREQAINKLRNEENAKVDEIKTELETKIKELNDQFDATISMQAVA